MKLTEKIVKENNLIDSNGNCVIPEGYTEIGDGAFWKRTNLVSIKLSNSILKIRNGAFWNCTSLKSINIPSGLKYIGHSAFCNCTSLTSINIPDSVKKIGNCVFYKCVKLVSVEFANNIDIEEISRGAFADCTSLVSIKLPESLRSIERGAFENCTSLKSINLPNSLEHIGDNVFSVCTSLPKLGVGKEILEIALKDNYFEQYRGLCFCFKKIVSELILKYRKPICLDLELPIFIQKNAIKYANGSRYKDYWFKDNSDRKKFLEWMLSVIGKRNINDEILILRR